MVGSLAPRERSERQQAEIDRRAKLRQMTLLKRQLAIETARSEFLPFIRFMMPDPADPDDPDKSLYHVAPHHRATAAVLQDWANGKVPRLIFVMPPRHGKLIAHDVPVLTTAGWTTHGALRVGDAVFAPDGFPARVVALSDDADAAFEVETTDGETIACHGAHEWTVYDRSRSAWRTVETRYLASRALWNGPRGARGGRATFQLPDVAAITLPDSATPVDSVSQDRGIAAVREIAPRPGRCIQVDRADGLYLVGRKLVPTHNSEQVSKQMPAWMLGRNPRMNLAVCTYSDQFAEDFGADVRAIMRSDPYKQVFPKHKFRRGGAAKDRIQTELGGLAVFVGRGGALTGRGADRLIIDDLFKDHEEARSPAIRDQAWNWFVRVASTRLSSESACVLITMTRWHEDDIVGRLTDPDNPHYNAEEAATWKIIRLPAIAEKDDPLGREPGEPLWPTEHGKPKFGLPYLQRIQRLDPFAFAAMYQQEPSVEEGVVFRREHVRYWSKDGRGGEGVVPLPASLRYYCSSDHAVGKDRRKHDATCLLPWGVDELSNVYLFTPFWERADSAQVVEAMLAMAAKWNPILWYAESGHISKAIGPFLKRRMIETQRPFMVKEIVPVDNKEQRAQSFLAKAGQGQIYFPRFGGDWVERAISELLKFPNGRNDDFCDACSLIGLGLRTAFGADKAPRKAVELRPGTYAWYRQQEKLMNRARESDGGW